MKPIARFAGLCALCLGLFAGCGSVPQPLPFLAPPMESRVVQFAGSPLAGFITETAPAVPGGGALQARFRLEALEDFPETELQPLASHIRLITTDRGGEPILAAPRRIRGARVGFDLEAEAFFERLDLGKLGRSDPMTCLDGALLPGATTVFELDGHPPERLEFQVQADPLRFFLCFHDADQKQEQILLATPDPGAASKVALVLSTPFEHCPDFSLALWIEVGEGTESEGTESGQIHYDFPDTEPEPSHVDSALEKALEGLALATSRRHILSFLSGECGADLAHRLALAAGDEQLAAMSAKILEKTRKLSEVKPETLAWILEQAALQVLAERLAQGDPEPELLGILTMYAGGVSNDTYTLREISATARNLADLERLLVLANLLALEESSPAARVRAYDWLALKGRAPEGFDPLAPARERRDALGKAGMDETLKALMKTDKEESGS